MVEHQLVFHYVYHCHIKSITFSIIFHSTTWNSMLKLLKDCKKYSVNTYASVEISLNTCRNTLDLISCVIWNCFPKSGHIYTSKVYSEVTGMHMHMVHLCSNVYVATPDLDLQYRLLETAIANYCFITNQFYHCT